MLVSRCSKWSILVTDVLIELDSQGATARLVMCCLFHVVILELSKGDCRGLSSVWAQQDPAHLLASQNWGTGPVPATCSILTPFLRGHHRKEGPHSLYVCGDTSQRRRLRHNKFATLCQTLVMNCGQVSDIPRSLAAP